MGKHEGFGIQCSWSKSSSTVYCVNLGILFEHCDSQLFHPIKWSYKCLLHKTVKMEGKHGAQGLGTQKALKNVSSLANKHC